MEIAKSVIERSGATYLKQDIKEFEGNPLIEALPPIYSMEEVLDLLAVYPPYHSSERELSSELRVHLLQRLFHFFQPFKTHFELESLISIVMRQGYVTRNPLNRESKQFLNKSYEAIRDRETLNPNEFNFSKTTSGFAIVGLSGIGKTTGIERVLSLYPKIIKHTFYDGMNVNFVQIPYLKLDCPYSGSLGSLCDSFFKKLDELLGDTEYFIRYGTRHNIATKIQLMSHLARLHNIGVLVVDEIQHLMLSGKNGPDSMLNFFVTLVNTIGVPVILIGTNKAAKILKRDFRQARRASGQGDLIWGKMEKDKMWDIFIRGIEKYQWTRVSIDLDTEFSDVLYEESQGILDIALKLYMLAQLKAIGNREEKLSVKLIRRVAKENLQLVQPMLDALKTNDLSQLELYDDIKPIDIDERFKTFRESEEIVGLLEKKSRQKEKIEKSNSNELLIKLIKLLNEYGEKETKVLRSAEKVLEKYKGQDVEFAVLVREATSDL
ncbi:ATP-binding protein [Terribacillus halophilus]|uniref:ATP-binding protein n=1 Tax=Terribacillus halophilus TaxID=361279 RepID=UPI0009859FAC|nr:ATP-binding protein [Terribacillus halophilus]